jgi:hypothetical protein
VSPAARPSSVGGPRVPRQTHAAVITGPGHAAYRLNISTTRPVRHTHFTLPSVLPSFLAHIQPAATDRPPPSSLLQQDRAYLSATTPASATTTLGSIKSNNLGCWVPSYDRHAAQTEPYPYQGSDPVPLRNSRFPATNKHFLLRRIL